MKLSISVVFLSLLTPQVRSLAPQPAKAKRSVTRIKSSTISPPAAEKAVRRPKWGVDNSHPEEYWFDHRIHTLGNVGLSGALHAALAPISTKLIDVLAYDGVDIRFKVSTKLKKLVNSQNARVLDLCCGVGMSTRALRDAFPDSATVIGMDTSNEMVSMAKFLTSHIEAAQRDLNFGFLKLKEVQANACSSAMFEMGNAEDTKLPPKSFDLVTVMYAFHEAPREGRDKILREAYRLLQPGGKLAVVDISSDYTPSSSMLSGEPYVLEYQEAIHQQLADARGFMPPVRTTLVPKHVDMWVLQRAAFA